MFDKKDLTINTKNNYFGLFFLVLEMFTKIRPPI